MLLKKPLKIKFENQNFIIKDYSICSNLFSKMRGLMFRGDNYRKPLLFIWRKPKKRAIHSFFCREFVAVWMLKNKNQLRIIDERIVKPFKSCVIPKEKFNLLLEVPLAYFRNSDGKAKV